MVNLSSMLGSLEIMGKSTLAYRMSKSAVNAMTRVFAAELADENIKVNSVCPGWVKTDLGGEMAPVTASEGAYQVVLMTELASSGPTGSFFRDGESHPW